MRETPDEQYTFAVANDDEAGGDGEQDRTISVPLYSLYSERREPTDEQMSEVDTLVVDLPDIGCR